MAKSLKSVFNMHPNRNSESAPMPGIPESGPSDTPSAESPASGPRALVILGKTLHLKGELSADEDLVLLGRVEGSIRHTESLTVGVGGVVVGDIRARLVTIKGTVKGDIEATEAIVIALSAVVTGDIIAPRVSIVEGAQVNGSVRMVASATADEILKDDAVTQGRSSFEGEYVVSARALDRLLSTR